MEVLIQNEAPDYKQYKSAWERSQVSGLQYSKWVKGTLTETEKNPPKLSGLKF